MYLKILIRGEYVLPELGKLELKHSVKFSKGTWHQIKIRERNGPSRGIVQKCAPHERSPCAPTPEERSHEETLIQERSARNAAWDLAKNIYKLKNSDKTMFYVPGDVKAMPAHTSRRPEEREFAVDSIRDLDGKMVQKPEGSVDC